MNLQEIKQFDKTVRERHDEMAKATDARNKLLEGVVSRGQARNLAEAAMRLRNGQGHASTVKAYVSCMTDYQRALSSLTYLDSQYSGWSRFYKSGDLHHSPINCPKKSTSTIHLVWEMSGDNLRKYAKEGKLCTYCFKLDNPVKKLRGLFRDLDKI